MVRVEINVEKENLETWDTLAKRIGINRTSLIKIAMSQYIRRNRMLFKIEAQDLTKYETALKQLKEFDASKSQIIKVPKKGNKGEVIEN